jgi:hypothetical protein
MRAGPAGGRLATAVAIMLTMAAPTWAQADGAPPAAMDGRWHFNLAPYVWMTGIKGDVSVGNRLTVPIDASFSDILDNFDLGFQGRFEARKDRLGFATDFVWMNLGIDAVHTQVADFKVDFRQFVAEGIGFYRVASGGRADNPAHLDVLAGVRYTTSRTRLTAESAAGNEFNGNFQDLDWVDAVGGVKFRAPLGSKVSILGRTDIAGLGSDLTWNLEGDLAFLASRHWTLGAGWRYMDIDYDKGEGIERRQLDLAYSGPRVWFAYSW